jgi:hypothetical protein
MIIEYLDWLFGIVRMRGRLKRGGTNAELEGCSKGTVIGTFVAFMLAFLVAIGIWISMCWAISPYAVDDPRVRANLSN